MSRDSSSLFDLEAIVPSQYPAWSGRDDGTSAERRLMLAVLRDAVDCYQRHALARDERGKALFADAKKWIESDEREWPLSYENICETLRFDTTRIRRELSRWHQARAPLKRRTARIVSLRGRRLSAAGTASVQRPRPVSPAGHGTAVGRQDSSKDNDKNGINLHARAQRRPSVA